MKVTHRFLTVLICTCVIVIVTEANAKNGFDISNSLIDINDIHFGGPPRDGIPALNNPRFVSAKEQKYLEDSDRILGLNIAGISKAYPVRILNWHEVVNDQFEDIPISIVYCPLCGTGTAFHTEIEDIRLEFGVSGLLYNSDVLMYDRQTESLWSQIQAQAISGSFAGTTLMQFPLLHTTWKQWREKHPDSLVLSDATGFTRDYSRNPYTGYEHTENLYFPVTHSTDELFNPKETVLGVKLGEKTKAYPFSLLDEFGKSSFKDTLAGESITIHWDELGYSAWVDPINGTDELSFMQGFWFAWYTFYPETEIFEIP